VNFQLTTFFSANFWPAKIFLANLAKIWLKAISDSWHLLFIVTKPLDMQASIFGACLKLG